MLAQTSRNATCKHTQSQESAQQNSMTLAQQFTALGMAYPEEAILATTPPQPVFKLWPENQKVARYFLEIWGELAIRLA